MMKLNPYIDARPCRRRIDEHGEYLQFDMGDGLVDLEAGDYALVLPYRWRIFHRGEFSHYVMAGSSTAMHRLLMGFPEGLTVDHIDGNTLNNRRYNLRVVTWQQNKESRHNTKGTASGRRGVYDLNNGSFSVIIGINGKPTYIGTYRDPDEAARVWDAKAREIRGIFTFQNFPNNAR